MSELSGKPLETCFEVVIRFESKEEAEACKDDIERHSSYSADEVREVAK